MTSQPSFSFSFSSSSSPYRYKHKNHMIHTHTHTHTHTYTKLPIFKLISEQDNKITEDSQILNICLFLFFSHLFNTISPSPSSSSSSSSSFSSSSSSSLSVLYCTVLYRMNVYVHTLLYFTYFTLLSHMYVCMYVCMYIYVYIYVRQ